MKEKDKGLILGPYKEPLTEVKNGHGYLGALTFDTLGRLQCHECGELFDNLSSHLNNTHKINAKEYREKYQLGRSTKLISERSREEKKNTHLRYLMSLTPEQRAEHKRKAYAAIARCNELRRERIKNGQYNGNNNSLETKNKRGLCPDQLLEMVRRAHQHYGYTPTMREFEKLFGYRYNDPIRNTYGSWTNAVKKAGLSISTKKGGLKKGTKRPTYSDEELLEFLANFWLEHGKIPTAGDCFRGFIPSHYTYAKRFGSFPRARELAHVPHYVMNQRRKNTLTLPKPNITV